MGARLKLNQIYLMGSLVAASVIGLLTQSWLVFLVGLIALVALRIYANEIRLGKRGR